MEIILFSLVLYVRIHDCICTGLYDSSEDKLKCYDEIFNIKLVDNKSCILDCNNESASTAFNLTLQIKYIFSRLRYSSVLSYIQHDILHLQLASLHKEAFANIILLCHSVIAAAWML